MLGIIKRFAEEGYQIEPDAVELIRSYTGEQNELIEQVVRHLDSSVVVVSADHIKTINYPFKNASHNVTGSRDLLTTPLAKRNPPGEAFSKKDEDSFSRQIPAGGEGPLGPHQDLITSGDGGIGVNEAYNTQSSVVVDLTHTSLPKVELQGDITGTSKCIGEYSDFVKYFRDRYGRLREMFSGRVNARPIESIGKKTADRDISIIGMVLDIRTTAKGHRVVELEDPTGIVSVILQKGSSAFDQSANIVTDEVIGVTGTTDGNGRIFAKSFVWPDIPSQNAPLEDAEGAALFLSDLHVGSKFFLEDAWIRFISWIKGELDDPMGLRENVRYLVIAGDLVDGVGVYPGQENDLAVNDINCQYEQAAEYLGQIPDNICIVISPGNHDAVRLAEPQPALPATFQGLFKKSCVFVGNPAWVSLGGRNCLIYHGRSIDDLVLKVPGISYGEPEKAMVEMLKRRHLAPIYGSRVSIAPEEVDHLVIQRPPSIFHCGHVHAVGITRYKGVTVINSGTWQSQTEYQKKMNLQPTPGIVPYVDLETMRVRKLQFA